MVKHALSSNDDMFNREVATGSDWPPTCSKRNTPTRIGCAPIGVVPTRSNSCANRPRPSTGAMASPA